MISFFLSLLFTLSQCRTYTPKTYNPNVCGSDICRGSSGLWTRTLDRKTMAGLPQYVVCTVSATAGDNTEQNIDKGHTSSPRIKLKISDPAGTQTQAAGLQVRDSTDHAMVTELHKTNPQNYIHRFPKFTENFN